MPIYVSKRAIKHYPGSLKPVDINGEINPSLKSILLQRSEYLKRLNRNDMAVKPLQKGDNNDAAYLQAIYLVKIALNTIDEYTGTAYEISGGPLNTRIKEYDLAMETAVKAFQVFTGLEQTGVVDSKTLKKIDDYLQGDDVFGFLDEYLGRISDKKIQPNINEAIDEQGIYTYKISFTKDGKPISLSTQEPLTVTPIIKESGLDGKMSYLLTPEGKEQLRSNSGVSEQDLNQSFAFIETTINETILTDELGKTPPTLLKSDETKLYKIKDGDTLLNIVLNNYYNKEEVLENPYDQNAPIFTFPSRTPSSPENRNDDARLQFYLNLIYYYNTTETDQGVTEFGILANSGDYIRYNLNDLDGYYIFNNAYDSSDAQTGLPNYYRFLEAQESLSSKTRIKFDASGNTNAFSLRPGYNMWIPSRRFADSLYYHLNFRHAEMLKPNSDGYLEYVSASVGVGALIDFINEINSTSVFDALTDWFKNEIKELYEETLEFFTSFYNFIINTLAEYWPRGVGGRLGLELGITWGYPIATDIKGEKSLWRKMTDHKDFTLVYRGTGEFYVGIDAAVGGGVGVYTGSGRRRKKVGFTYGAGVEIGVRPSYVTEYEFPIRPEETGFLSAMVASLGKGAAPVLGAELLEALDIININPRHYITTMKLSFVSEAQVWGAGSIDFNFDPDGNLDETKDNLVKVKSSTQTAIDTAKNIGYLGVDNIWKYVISGIGIQANAFIALGVEVSYKAKYENNPLVPENDARVPNEVEIENTWNAKGILQVGTLGNLLQSFLVNTYVGGLFELLNFNRGIALSFVHIAKRTGEAKNLTLPDVDISNSNTATITNLGNGNLKHVGTIWESYMNIGTSTGDPDTLCSYGTEAKIKLDTYRLHQWREATFSIGNILDILDIFYSYEFRYKLAAGKSYGTRKKLSNSLLDTIVVGGDNKVIYDFKRNLLTKATSKKFGLDLGAGLDIGIEFKVQDIRKVLTYLLQRHLVISRLRQTGNPLKELELFIDESEKRKSLIKKLTSDNVVGSEYYAQLYDGLLTDFLEKQYSTELEAPDFSEGFVVYLSIFSEFNTYLNTGLSYDEQTKKYEKTGASGAETDLSEDALQKFKNLGVNDIMQALSSMAQIFNTKVVIEAKLGGAGGFDIKAGEGATIALALGGVINLIDHTIIMEDGALTIKSGDPLYDTYLAMKNIIEHKVDGVQQSFLFLRS